MRTRRYGELAFMLLGLSLVACAAVDGGGSAEDTEPPAPRRGGSGTLGDLADLVPTPDAATPPGDAAPSTDDAAPPAGDAGPSLDGTPPPADAAPPADAVPPPPDAPAPATRPPCQNEGARRACPPVEQARCPSGVQVCEDGAWSVCRGPAETCNDTDDDCDGAADEGLGRGRACTVGVGACGREGVGQCAPDGTVACAGVPGRPAAEQCDALDNDCDGRTDEGVGAGAACEAGVGACLRAGVRVCSPDGIACNVEAGVPTPELCNAADDDCDGSTDEGFDLGTLCSVGVGACARQGQIECGLVGATTCSAREGRPGVEACNGLDDDCDGSTDEGFDLGAPCEAVVGACAVRGVLICDDVGAAVCSVRPGAPESCDALDNDCDGNVDEGFDVGADCVVGGGACVAEGVVECTPQGRGVCSARNPFALDVGDGSDGELVVAGRTELDPDRLYQFTRVEVQAGGILTLRALRRGEIGRLDVKVAGAVVVQAGGRIDLDGAGYAGGPANPKVVRVYQDQWTSDGGSNGVHGAGPGGGGGGWAAPQQTVGAGGGGGYGGRGVDGVFCGIDDRNYTVWDDNVGGPLPIANPLPRYSSGGEAYGDEELALVEPGSGGGSGGNNYDGGADGVGGAGGPGGGALRLVATSLTVEAGGEISADGAPGQPGVGGAYVGGGGGGSGGALALTAIVVRIDGALTALGASGAGGTGGSIGGGGGDGRVRLDAGVIEALADVDPALGFQGALACVQ